MFEEHEDVSRSDDEEDSRPHLDEGGDLDEQADDPVHLFNEPDTNNEEGDE